MKSISLVIVTLLIFLTTSLGLAQDIQGLFLGDNGHHLPRQRFAELQPVLRAHGIQLTYTDQLADLNALTLAKYDVFILYANIDEIDRPAADALLKYVDAGGGFVPLHCASFCFRNVPEVVALMGAQFKQHGTGVFRSEVAAPEHDVTKGYGGFQSWDETYVHHLHNEANRTVLEYRFGDTGREPWTWIRTQGQGRVFYTAWGHDGRTWTNPGFQNLVERGIRWAAKQDAQAAGEYLVDAAFPVPEMNAMPTDLKPFEYADVGGEIPNYTPSEQWGALGKPLNLMQKPLLPDESLKHLIVPKGFHAELFVSEPQLAGKPICMTWDERGRLWVGETVDYPNERQPPGQGRDQIRICEDTDNDGRADTFKVFAEGLSIPTSMMFHRGGVIVQNGIETLYLKDLNGDDQADERRVLFTGWDLGDTHGGVSNFQYGLDNWIWGMQGYNNSAPQSPNHLGEQFRQGFFRMQPDDLKIEFIRSTNNNTWGLGISEEGIIFGSTANGCPSVYMPIPNRYYERVLGWKPSLTLESIADTFKFSPITKNIRQVDYHGGYTAGAGHALYTAREYPREYWNRVAFVNGPTGHLVGSFVLNRQGSDFRSTSPINLLASDDEWTAPIMSEVGPDGQVWVIDWYNYIVQHNPTPQGFKTGKGQAYETKLRDKIHGRIYRVVANTSKSLPIPNLTTASPAERLAALKHPTMLIRKHAQRLLVEQGDTTIADGLIALIRDQSRDEIGLNVGAIHALWTLHGLGLSDGSNLTANEVVVSALRHPSPGVRRNAIQVLPPTKEAVAALIEAQVLRDPDHQVRLAAILALSDLPHDGPEAAHALLEVILNPNDMADRWIPDAVTCAAALNSQHLIPLLATAPALSETALSLVQRLADHHVRSDRSSDAAELLARLNNADPRTIESVLQGFSQGWKPEKRATLKFDATVEAQLEQIFGRLSPGAQGKLITLANAWGSQKFTQYNQQIITGLLSTIRDQNTPESARIAAAEKLIEFLPDDGAVVINLLDEMTLQMPPLVSVGIIRALDASRWEGVGKQLLERIATMTPTLKQAVYQELLQRTTSTRALLDAAEANQISLDELELDQRVSLASHPDVDIQRRANELLSLGGTLPDKDREQVIGVYAHVVQQSGDVAKGKLVFVDQCSKCHRHGEIGIEIGPNLTGMAVHPKDELLVHILDPSRSVEANFRTYKAMTIDGVLINGMLMSESKTSIELIDTEGKKTSLLRADIEQLAMSKKSVMPDGFEKTIPQAAMADLLEFLTLKGKYLPLPFDRLANTVSTRGIFHENDNGPDRMIFEDWTPKTFNGVPFVLVDPLGSSKPNIVVLNARRDAKPEQPTPTVKFPCNSSAKAIHLLSGVGGWCSPYDDQETVSLIVRLKYCDGQSEDHELVNGIHFADYIRRVDVPNSEFAFDLAGRQIRYLSISPRRTETIESIELVKGPDQTAPIVMAITVETLPQLK